MLGVINLEKIISDKKYTLKSFAPLLQNISIHLKTDTSVITRKGRNKTSLQELAENIYKMCRKFDKIWNNNSS